MTALQRKAVKNIINAIEDPESYLIRTKNSPEENAAIADFLKKLFIVDSEGKVKDFNEAVIKEYAALQSRPLIDIF